MIKIKHLTFTYPGADQPNLKDITLQIQKGDFLAVIGNNGCGKSTLCKTLNGLIPHFISGDFEGSVEIGGEDTRGLSIGGLAGKVGYVYQDFENQIVRPTVLDDASYACLNYAMTDYEQKGLEALNMCGLGSKAKNYVWQLSGGQKHLLALAGMTALCPEILILDEPIAQLDPAHAKQIYDVLRDLNEKFHKTIIVIEHHTEYIVKYCRNAVLMRDGQIVWKLPVREALQKVDELVSCNIFPPQITMAASQLQKSGVLPKEASLPTTLEEGITAFRGLVYHKSVIQDISRNSPRELMVQFCDVSLDYPAIKGNASKVFHNFSLNICRGEKIALIGSNGAGKSSLMKLMIGLLKPSSGEILMKGEKTRRLSPEALSQIVSLVYQNPEEMFIKDSIRGDIEYAMKVRQIKDYEKRTKELLSLFHLTDLSHRDGRLLSGGQMRRASLAIGIALNPSVLLLDEPTANLDIATRKEIMRTLSHMKEITETVVIATHDMQLVCEWADRIIVLSSGQIIADGDRNHIFNNTEAIEKTGILPPEIYSLGKALDTASQCYTITEFINSFGKEELENVV